MRGEMQDQYPPKPKHALALQAQDSGSPLESLDPTVEPKP